LLVEAGANLQFAVINTADEFLVEATSNTVCASKEFNKSFQIKLGAIPYEVVTKSGP
jgi:hypothetical protein